MRKFQHVGTIKTKLQRGKFRNKDLTNNSKIMLGDYGVQLCSKGFIGIKEIIAAKKILSKLIKGIGYLWVRFMPQRSITKKPLEVRMGKGKGKHYTWIANIKAGMLLFEISRINMTGPIKKKIKNALTKLSFHTKLIVRLL